MKNITSEMGARIATWLGAIGVVLGIALVLIAPKPNTSAMRGKAKQQEQDIQVKAEQARIDFAKAQAIVATRTWKGTAAEVGPGALQSMNTLAVKYRVKLSGFRPERTSQNSGLDFLPFSVTATGAYLDLVAFVKAIETPDNKLAVDSLQIASSEANSDQVIATVGITAYRESKETKGA